MLAHSARATARSKLCAACRRAAAWALLGTALVAAAACSVARYPDLPTEEELRLRHQANVARVLHPPTMPERILSAESYAFNLRLVLVAPVAAEERVAYRQVAYDQWSRLAERQRVAIVRIEQHRAGQIEAYLALQQRARVRVEGPSELVLARRQEAQEQWERIAQRQREAEIRQELDHSQERRRFQELQDRLRGR